MDTKKIQLQLDSHSEPAENGCIEWNGGRYGNVSVNGIKYKAHRMSYIINHGLIPEGHLVCHLCGNPKCINPDHLFIGTHKENTQDMVSKGRDNFHWMAK